MVPSLPTGWARTTAEFADGVAVALDDAVADAEAAGPLLWPPQATKSDARRTVKPKPRRALMSRDTRRRYALDRVDLDLPALDADVQRGQAWQLRIVPIGWRTIGLEGCPVAGAFELVTELAVVEDATHVGTHGRKALHILPFPDQESLDRPGPERDRRAFRQVGERLDRLPGAL